MKYITVAQFFRAKFEVRKEILSWWQPEIGDLVEGERSEVKCISTNEEVAWARAFLGKRDTWSIIPLLTAQQLIDFIEYKSNDEIDI